MADQMGPHGYNICVEDTRRATNQLVVDGGIAIGSGTRHPIEWCYVHLAMFRRNRGRVLWVGAFQTNVSGFTPQDTPAVPDQPVIFSSHLVGAIPSVHRKIEAECSLGATSIIMLFTMNGTNSLRTHARTLRGLPHD